MWKFSGDINYTCKRCKNEDSVSIDDCFEVEHTGGDERGMGTENIYEIRYDFDCEHCDNDISLVFEASEYPIDFVGFFIDNSTGAETGSEPYQEHLPEYDEDLFYIIPKKEIITPENRIITDISTISAAIPQLINFLKLNFKHIYSIHPREFEEVIAEIFRNKGFDTILTPSTRDDGKDVIAISNNDLGIETKYFIECKRYSLDNKVGVGIVRELHGVKNTRDSANKSIIATTSTFTSGANKFVNEKISSCWDMSLKDYNDIKQWIRGYNQSN